MTNLAGEPVVNTEEELGRYKDEVLVKEILSELGDPQVKPVPVDEKGPLEVHELGKGKVGAHGRLSTLLPRDTQPHVGLLYHGHVVAPVADCRGHWSAGRALHQLHHLLWKQCRPSLLRSPVRVARPRKIPSPRSFARATCGSRGPPRSPWPRSATVRASASGPHRGSRRRAAARAVRTDPFSFCACKSKDGERIFSNLQRPPILPRSSSSSKITHSRFVRWPRHIWDDSVFVILVTHVSCLKWPLKKAVFSAVSPLSPVNTQICNIKARLLPLSYVCARTHKGLSKIGLPCNLYEFAQAHSRFR
jgi:hypothetical protein